MNISSAAVIGAFILMIPLWILYHKIFTVFYFDFKKAILSELASACITGYIISYIFLSLLHGVAIGIGSLLAFAFQVIVVTATIYMYAVFIWAYLERKKRVKARLDISDIPEYTGISHVFWSTWQFMKKKAPYSFIVIFCVMGIGTMRICYLLS